MMRGIQSALLVLSLCGGGSLTAVRQAFAAENEVEVRAASVCAGLGSGITNFQGTMTIDDLSVKGEGNGTATLYRGGVDLGKIQPGTYQQFNDCLLSVMRLIMPKSDPEYATCTRPEFGLVGYENQETLPGTSGWRGGGYNQNAYCTDFINGVVAARGLSGNDYKIDIISSSEDARWSGVRRREYNYHCTIKVLTSPMYNSRRDALCGIMK